MTKVGKLRGKNYKHTTWVCFDTYMHVFESASMGGRGNECYRSNPPENVHASKRKEKGKESDLTSLT